MLLTHLANSLALISGFVCFFYLFVCLGFRGRLAWGSCLFCFLPKSTYQNKCTTQNNQQKPIQERSQSSLLNLATIQTFCYKVSIYNKLSLDWLDESTWEHLDVRAPCIPLPLCLFRESLRKKPMSLKTTSYSTHHPNAQPTTHTLVVAGSTNCNPDVDPASSLLLFLSSFYLITWYGKDAYSPRGGQRTTYLRVSFSFQPVVPTG